ncbi:MAG TPA: alpha/beta hydrolase [Actinomycetota bacterium]|nr:alpha/beta hydrolase [Actinomycetota bacterium]
MNGPTRATTREETPVFFRAGDEDLFGIVTRPNGAATGTGFMILSGGAVPFSSGRNDMSVHLCRRLAGMGHTSLRFDYHGAGESTGIVERVELGRTHVEDTLSAVDVLREHGATRIVLAGSCGGARNALAAAKDVPELQSLILFSLPLRDHDRVDSRAHRRAAREWNLWQYVRRALRPKTWRGFFDRRLRRVYLAFAKEKIRAVRRGETAKPAAPKGAGITSPTVQEELIQVIRRGIPILLVYGDEDDYYKDFVLDQNERLGSIIERGADVVDLQVLPGKVHSFHTLDLQEQLRSLVYEWLDPEKADRSTDGAARSDAR